MTDHLRQKKKNVLWICGGFCFCNSPKQDISSCGSCHCHILLIFNKPSQKIPPQWSLSQFSRIRPHYTKQFQLLLIFCFQVKTPFTSEVCLCPEFMVTVPPPLSSSNIMFQVSSYSKLDCTRPWPTHTKQEPFKNKTLEASANNNRNLFPKVPSKQ